MMKTAICYYSYHHNNTKKLLDAIVEKNSDVVLIDVTKDPSADFSSYDRIVQLIILPSKEPNAILSPSE